MARRRKKRSGPKKVPVRYVNGDVDIKYVSRTKSELPKELKRVQDGIHQALRILSRLKRLRHTFIVTARFQLEHCLRDVPEGVEPEWLANEIARLSFVMEDTCSLLNRLEHARTHWLEQARFVLTYGQTPKQREPAGSYSSKLQKEENGSDKTDNGEADG